MEATVEPVPADTEPTPLEMVANDGPKGSDLPVIDLDRSPDGEAPTARPSAPCRHWRRSPPRRSSRPADRVHWPAHGGPVEADNRSAGGPTQTTPPPPPASATGLGGPAGLGGTSGVPGATGGPGVSSSPGLTSSPGVSTGGTSGTATSLAAATGPATPTGGSSTPTHSGSAGTGGSGFDAGRGIDDRRWQTDGRMNWGDDGVDPTSVTRPDASDNDIDFGDDDQ